MSMSVCLCVCLSVCEHISGATCAIFFCMLPMAVAWSSPGRVTKSQGEGTILGFSSPLTMHCNVFAANNVMQQKGSFHRCRGRGVMGMYSASEV